MNILPKKKIVFLGMMTKIPVAGAVWGTVHYLVGFQRLGYDVYYVEAHARTPSMFMTHEQDDGSGKAAKFVADVMEQFDMGDRWAFHALHEEGGKCYGMSETKLKELYASADLLINYHGGTVPLPEHTATNRLIYLETDPVELEIEIYNGIKESTEFLAQHIAIFTWGLNYNQPDCQVPLDQRFRFTPLPPALVLDLWRPFGTRAGRHFTTVGNWKQMWREVRFKGQTYYWSKHFEFLKFMDLPKKTKQTFELALASYEEKDRKLLERNRWRVCEAMDFSTDLDAYRKYIGTSRGAFTVAKDQNVRLRSGWFSERSAQYLAAGKPVIDQDTGFGNYLPTGRGLFAFSTMDDVLAAVDAINSDYANHCRGAYEIAREYFSYDVVLKRLLADVGV
jgi:hypothetical protein